MYAILKVEFRLPSHPLKEKGVKKHLVLLGQPGVQSVKRVPIFGSNGSRRLHAGQKHRNFSLLKLANDSVESSIRHLNINSPQHVICAKLNDNSVGA